MRGGELGEEGGSTGRTLFLGGWREAQGLVIDTDTAVLLLGIYLVWWGKEGEPVSGDSRHPEHGSG